MYVCFSVRINYYEDAKKVAKVLLEEKPKKVTVIAIARILHTSNSYRACAVRDILLKEGVINQNKTLNLKRLKEYVEG